MIEILTFIACKTGIPLQETGKLTRVEAWLMYKELKQQEIRVSSQMALTLLPILQASGLLAIGNKKSVGKADRIFGDVKRELTKTAYGK